MDLTAWAGNYRSDVYRIVESQEKVATMRIVDTLKEQAYLEELIEGTKPAIQNKPLRHYLIQTPFRYPPLKHGSRFGTRFEPSIFYAGESLNSALCESAFYSFYFLSRSIEPFKETIINHKTSFSARIDSTKHADLTLIEDSDTQQQLRHKTDYSFTQQLGKQMRSEGFSSFSYTSARCNDKVNVGVFDIDAIKGNPSKLTHWEIKQTPEEILFFCPSKTELNATFNVNAFQIEGILPHPSS
jgi:hypothetical protein